MYLKKIDFMWTMNQMAFKNINWISFLGIFRGLIQKKALEQDVMLWRHDDESEGTQILIQTLSCATVSCHGE